MTRITAALGLFLAACDQPSDPSTTGDNAAETKADDKDAYGKTAPDNTAVNDRDRDGATLTPEDQGNNPSDLAITQRVRQAIMDEDALTTGEKNVKVISVNGTVTLRGPVESEESKSKIAALAKEAAGVQSVDNQLEVTGTATASADATKDDDKTTK
jgi:osmotically-inducible protein OsmY